MRPPLEELAGLYEEETGERILIDYGDSGELLIRIRVARRGDLYVCHDPFANALMKQKLGAQVWTVASLQPVIVVPKGNPKRILGLRDLAREGIRLGLTDERYSTLGHLCPVMFDRVGLRDQIEKNVVTRQRMGGQIANMVEIGSLDAGMAWDAVVHARLDKLDAVPIEPEYRLRPGVDAVSTATFGHVDQSYIRVTIAVLSCSRRQRAARNFAEFVASERGQAVFDRHGFSGARSEG